MRIICISLVLALFAIASCDDYEDQVAQEEEYCRKVKSGAWGAYKSEIDCGGDE